MKFLMTGAVGCISSIMSFQCLQAGHEPIVLIYTSLERGL